MNQQTGHSVIESTRPNNQDNAQAEKILAALYPTDRNTVLSLLTEAGFDCSDWSNYKKPETPAANPKYCYEWAFYDDQVGLIINLWHKNFFVEEGCIHTKLNMRELSRIFSERKQSVIEKRAISVDTYLQRASKSHAKVSVIVLEGDIRDLTDNDGKKSVVSARRLDSESWGITHYDWITGECVLTRGAKSQVYVDQFSDALSMGLITQRKEVSGTRFVRSGAVRAKVLSRAKGLCEYCGQSGFVTTSGAIYLETHHVVPLADGGLDESANVIALCPVHHRQAHYGASAFELAQAFKRLLREKQ